uniref:Leucine-rich repeat-containing protein 49 n=1 Tax=Steinernema glaseri TaxID=37863 RepID=A0A1I7YZA5_9BILA
MAGDEAASHGGMCRPELTEQTNFSRTSVVALCQCVGTMPRSVSSSTSCSGDLAGTAPFELSLVLATTSLICLNQPSGGPASTEHSLSTDASKQYRSAVPCASARYGRASLPCMPVASMHEADRAGKLSNRTVAMTGHDSPGPGPSSDSQSDDASSSRSSSANTFFTYNADRKRLANGMLRPFKILQPEEVEQGSTTDWREIVIHGNVKNLNQNLYNINKLTALFLCRNNLSQLSANVVKLRSLQILDLSYNKIRTLPSQIGEMTQLQQLHLNNNLLRTIPYEIGKLKQLEVLNLTDNPLTGEFARLYSSGLDVARFLQFMTSHLSCMEHPGCRSSNAANKKKIVTTSAALQLLPQSLYRAPKTVWPEATEFRVSTLHRLQHQLPSTGMSPAIKQRNKDASELPEQQYHHRPTRHQGTAKK